MSRFQANLLLLFAAALWGLGNVPQKTVLDHLDPMSAVGLRCLIGGLLVLPFGLRENAGPAGAGFHAGLVRVSVLFSVSIALQQIAYLTTSVTNASFLISTATVMTPVAAWLLVGERIAMTVGLVAVLTLAGALLLAGGITAFGPGDMTVLLSAACYAVWTVELGRHMRTHARPFAAMTTQFLGAAAVTLPFGLLQASRPLAGALDAWPQLLVLGVLSTAVAFGIQTIAQRFTSPSHAAVIVSAESVFGALAAALFLGERISWAGAFGAAMMLGAILYLAISAEASSSSKSLTGPLERMP
jgi:drug/metabolite transporter (DMT)-like permease